MKLMNIIKIKHLMAALLVLFVTGGITETSAQFKNWWMAVGAYQNWYSEIGSEIEHGWEKRQQFGAQWPAIYKYKDSQAARAVWIGAKNMPYEDGSGNLSHRVVHVGPRVNGAGEFFPTKFEMYCKFEPPTITVDGVTSYQKDVAPFVLDETMPYDRLIINEANTLLGVTMERRIFQFSQEHHDDYIVTEITLTNTGNTDDDADIELPNQTVEDMYIFWQYRMAINQNTRYVIGNGTGWGMNTMLDWRGDGVKNDADADFRATYSWHGYFPPFNKYDNIGGPIWQPDGTAYTDASDTTGRLGASQFVGVVTLHADTSPQDPTDDVSQPSTTTWFGSDEPLTSNNDAYNETAMKAEYDLMSSGHRTPRHADVVEPGGKFTEPSGDPALGTPGGFSNCNGYGPYTLAPGESVTVVWAEGAGGLSRQQNIDIGRQYKDGDIDAKTKNEWVMTGKDSLFQTFRRSIENFNSGYDIPEPPLPPQYFTVTSGGDRISLSWVPYAQAGPAVTAYEIYRTQDRYDNDYGDPIATLSPTESAYDDTDLKRGVNYYYYIQAVGDASDNNGSPNTPKGTLRSSRYYTQTYDPATLKRPAGDDLDAIRIVPNPFVISADASQLRFGTEDSDRLAFFNVPGQCTIDIYTELGEKITSIDHTDGSGDAYWKCRTSSNQVVVSGIYIAVFTDSNTGERAIKKFAIIR